MHPNHAEHNYLVNKQRFTCSTDHEVVLHGAPLLFEYTVSLQKMSGCSKHKCAWLPQLQHSYVAISQPPKGYVGYPNLPRGM